MRKVPDKFAGWSVAPRSTKIRWTSSRGGVKLHVFEPSGTEIWTVVGRSGEHWQSPDARFCSCPGYYFDRRRGRSCYHLDAARQAARDGTVEITRFSDSEFYGFVAGLLQLLQSAE